MISCSHWGWFDIPEVAPSRLNEICKQSLVSQADAANFHSAMQIAGYAQMANTVNKIYENIGNYRNNQAIYPK